MGVWERIHLRSHSLLLFPPQPRHLPGYIRRTSASAHTSGPEGCALHAATSPFTGIRQCAPKAKELTVERHYTRLQERLSTGKSKMPACHGGRSGGSYDLPRRYPAENCRVCLCTGLPIRRDNLSGKAHIRRSSPHEAGGGTRTQVLTEQAPGKPDQTRSIPRKGYICRASLRETGADLYDRKVVLWLHG